MFGMGFYLIAFDALELLIQSYFNIVKRTMIDMVPKAVMLNLVARAKKELQQELLSELYKSDILDDLLQESEHTQQRRKECKKMIEVNIGWDHDDYIQLSDMRFIGTSKGR